MTRREWLLGTGSTWLLVSCGRSLPESGTVPMTIDTQSRIESFDPAFDSLVAPDAEVSLLADGFAWSEGPAWDTRRERLLFSDIPNNRVHSWRAETGLETFLDPAGRPPTDVDPQTVPGTNGIIYLADEDSLLICNQDARSIDRIDLSSGARREIISTYKGKPLNSPNDLVLSSRGDLYFTDPPYGLKGVQESPGRVQPHNGVYRLTPDGELLLVDGTMTLPNGAILSPDERTLYIAQSDPDAPLIFRFDVRADGSTGDARVFWDFSDMMGEAHPGLPDGMAVDTSGNLYATGPGGVTVISPEGKRLGRIHTGRATANCAFGEDGRTLFMTSHQTLLSIRTRATGHGFA